MVRYRRKSGTHGYRRTKGIRKHRSYGIHRVQRRRSSAMGGHVMHRRFYKG